MNHEQKSVLRVMRSIMGMVCLAMASNVTANPATHRPNVILCMADDQGWGDTGYNGHPFLKTPHLDQLSREGVTFTRFYSAAAMCSPTRGSCYTGRNPYRFGITFAMKGKLEATEIPITTVLKKQGYTTGHFGKWHLGTLSKIKGDQKRWGAFSKDPIRYYCPPWERDVDVCFVTESKVPTWNPLLDPGAINKKDTNANRGKPYGNDYFTGPHTTVTENTDHDDSRVIMDRAIPFIRNAARQNTPFLAVIWFHTPHSPVVGGPQYRDMYRDRPDHEQHYYACITAMDEQIGRLRTELDAQGIAGNTMLWYCSDNGPARQGSPRHVGSSGHLSGYKLSIREGGIRVPGLMIWPNKIKKPRTVTAPCVTSDYFPTILDALGIEMPVDRTYDGISLLPLIQGKTSTRTKPIGFLNKNAKEAVWMGQDYKLIHTPKGDALYNITEDPSEKTDLAKSRPVVKANMTRDLMQWKDAVLKELSAFE